jgi:hypothetical protein
VDAAVEHDPAREPDRVLGKIATIVGLSPLPDPGEYFGFTLSRAAFAVTVSIIAVRCAHRAPGSWSIAWATCPSPPAIGSACP